MRGREAYYTAVCIAEGYFQRARVALYLPVGEAEAFLYRMNFCYLRNELLLCELRAENVLRCFVKIRYFLYDSYFLIVAVEHGNI